MAGIPSRKEKTGGVGTPPSQSNKGRRSALAAEREGRRGITPGAWAIAHQGPIEGLTCGQVPDARAQRLSAAARQQGMHDRKRSAIEVIRAGQEVS